MLRRIGAKPRCPTPPCSATIAADASRPKAKHKIVEDFALDRPGVGCRHRGGRRLRHPARRLVGAWQIDLKPPVDPGLLPARPPNAKDLQMYHKRRDAAQNVAKHLIEAEAAIDEAVIKVSALAACIPTSRLAANLAAEVGHEALAGTMGVCQSLVEARARIVETHQSLAATSEAIGLPPRAFGPLPDKQSAHLEVVESKAA